MTNNFPGPSNDQFAPGATYPQNLYPNPPVARSTSYGMIGILIGLVTLVLGTVAAVIPTVILTNGGHPDDISSVSLVWLIIQAVCAIVATVFGVLGLRSDRDRVMPGIAIGIGGSILGALLLNLIAFHLVIPAMYN